MINKKDFFYKALNKTIIVLFYIFLFAFFLYFPVLKDFFLKADNVINVYTFTDMISSKTAEKFEKKTGVRVNLKYYDTNEELYAKFKVGGGLGYDLIVPSDYIVDLLKKDGLLHKIDKTKIKNFKFLDSRLIGLYFDLNNDYSVPYFWSVDGIIFNTKYLKDLDLDWDFVFKKPSLPFKICMLDNLRESLFISSIYLFGKTYDISDAELLKIKKLLIKQKDWVEVYLYSSLQYYLLTNVVPLAVTTSAFARKILEISDDFKFVIPTKGSLLMIDNLAIPKKSTKLELVYKFINFLISKKNIAYNANLYGYNPSNKDAYSLIRSNFLKNKAFFPDNKMFRKLHLIHNDLDMKKIDDLWLEVKLA